MVSVISLIAVGHTVREYVQGSVGKIGSLVSRLSIRTDQHHLLQNIIPEAMDVQYSLRERSHKFKLSARTSALSDCNFVTRVLFKTKGYR